MAHLHHDLIMEVFLLLPVKSLLRFRCVSKSWYEIISSRDFIYSHLDKSSINRQHRNVIQFWGAGTKRTIVRATDINNGIQEQFIQNFEMYEYNAAYCNGLILHQSNSEFVVWNPSTRHYRKLPEFNQSRGRRNIFCFGYDATTDDYKVVVILFPSSMSSNCEGWIFGFKSSHWRKISDFPSNYIDTYGNGFADGCVHFLFCDDYRLRSYIIMAFDVAKETSYVVPLPIYQGRGYPVFLLVFERCLAIKIFTEEDKVADLYVRKKNGVEFAWTKLFSVTTQQFSVFGLDGRLFNVYFKTLGYSKEGDKILLVYGGKIYSYDLKQASLPVLEWSSSRHIHSSMYCTETLVSIGS